MKCSVFKVAFFVLILSAVSYIYSDTVHEVQAGDTLYSIGRKYGVSVNAIQEANALSDNGIKVGQKIKIPDGKVSAAETPKTTQANATSASSATATTAQTKSQTPPVNSDGSYTVQKGETWFGISKKYGISVADLQKLNGVDANSSLKVGQKLKVPASSDKKTSGGSGTSTVVSAKSSESSKSGIQKESSLSSKKESSSINIKFFHVFVKSFIASLKSFIFCRCFLQLYQIRLSECL